METVTIDLILERAPSLGIGGWSDQYLEVRDKGLIDSEQRMRECQDRSLGGHGDHGSDDVQDQNVQIVKLIAALGAKENGRRIIPKAMAAKRGIDEQGADNILDGTSDRKLHVPAYLRSVLQDIGLGGGHGAAEPVRDRGSC